MEKTASLLCRDVRHERTGDRPNVFEECPGRECQVFLPPPFDPLDLRGRISGPFRMPEVLYSGKSGIQNTGDPSDRQTIPNTFSPIGRPGHPGRETATQAPGRPMCPGSWSTFTGFPENGMTASQTRGTAVLHPPYGVSATGPAFPESAPGINRPRTAAGVGILPDARTSSRDIPPAGH